MSVETNVAPKKGAKASKEANVLNFPFEFKKYERKELKQLGSILENFGAEAKVLPITQRNLNDVSKLINVVIELEDETSTLIRCSKAVSALVRNGEITMGEIVRLPMIETRYDTRATASKPSQAVVEAIISLPADESNSIQGKGRKIGETTNKSYEPSLGKGLLPPAW
jgi:hypothetical protein